MYLHLAAVTPSERPIEVLLSPPSVWLSVSGCDPDNPHRCEQLPNLVLNGEEPLPNEQIIRIQGFFNGEAFTCIGSECALPLPATGQGGVSVEFWADSSYGDSSPHFTAQVRAVPWGDFTSPEGETGDQPLWYVDILSTQWRGAPQASCAQVWSSFPDLGGPPPWLFTPNRPEDLQSTQAFYYLAGELIEQRVVDAQSCPDGGLQAPGMANECGMDLARPQVMEWQNRFDTELIRVALDTGIPAQLMKNIFARESQLWPGYYQKVGEAGLGQLTEYGADTFLLWNPSFFSQFCPLVYETTVCQRGFGNLSEDQQGILRGALVNKVNAACPDCPSGIDLSQANFSISVFARGLLANCEQTGAIVSSITGRIPGESASYSDLWRFTLVNYNAGSGCLTTALQEVKRNGLPVTWESVSSQLDPVCQAAVDYVDDITNMPWLPDATGTPVVPTPILNATALHTPTLLPTPTPGAGTPTPGGPGPGEPTPTPIGGYPEPPTPTPGNGEPTPTEEGYPEPTEGPSPTPPEYPYP
jgi:hypothetical protein